MPPPPTSLEDLLNDLEEEHTELDAIVGGRDGPSWDLSTPAEGWSVRDQIGHLAFFDDVATMALTDPDAFSAKAQQVLSSGDDPMQEHLRRGRAMDPPAILGWWRSARKSMLEAVRRTPPEVRVPWFGPPMGLKSFVSARIMETWAHGQDVADALGVERVPTDRLRHIAHLGVVARPFSYMVRGREVPAGTVRVELLSPSGELWVWDGGEDESSRHGAAVRGRALDFCLVVTQRRHRQDTDLVAEGSLATEWLEIAQAFAGPPGPGRSPGNAHNS